ncbi:MAG: acetoin:2,6-dichlorophenolindophenol oxidoreductase subunit alpha [Thermosediminibacterales bacterium]|nr:acetoin:2,6-dichlorophenolindophenol oxidoreductase subunit alpha [Thermosediminibacterales bacterium]MDK2836907.1 acetoin:2,6-dichlorophenolindophenol oxidoreductase subunit alpha [Thermosediminibacterales bacterium]
MNVQGYEKRQLLEFYSTMYKIRKFEEEVFELYKQGLMPGLAHTYVGEEAIATGACNAIEKGKDYVASTHRGHGHLIASGADLSKMMAEILGKKTGYCKGKGGSMHVVSLENNILGANGIVGGGIPLATGAAYTSKLKNTGQVTLSFFGDAATNQGTFHESLNMAAAWKLPVVYIIENNQFGISVSIKRVTAIKDLAERAKAYGMPGVVVDGNNVIEVYEKVKEAVELARKGEGPTLIECKTYRFRGHHVGDPGIEYRLQEEIEEWKAKCPIKRLKEALINNSIATEDDIKNIERDVDKQIEEAVEFAKQSPYPEPSEAFEDLFV